LCGSIALLLSARADKNNQTATFVQTDTVLTPVNSATGIIPRTVTTDINGVANFNLVYLKAHTAWITDEIPV